MRVAKFHTKNPDAGKCFKTPLTKAQPRGWPPTIISRTFSRLSLKFFTSFAFSLLPRLILSSLLEWKHLPVVLSVDAQPLFRRPLKFKFVPSGQHRPTPPAFYTHSQHWLNCSYACFSHIIDKLETRFWEKFDYQKVKNIICAPFFPIEPQVQVYDVLSGVWGNAFHTVSSTATVPSTHIQTQDRTYITYIIYVALSQNAIAIGFKIQSLKNGLNWCFLYSGGPNMVI